MTPSAPSSIADRGSNFPARKFTSAAGLLAYRELDDALGLTGTASESLEGVR
jgi:hypothetical protein